MRYRSLGIVNLYIVFVLGALTNTNANAAQQTAKIMSPRTGEKVASRDEVVGQVPDGVRPVLVVRSAEKNSHWWVQEVADHSSNGVFTAKSRFGNTKTPNGAKFQFVVLLPKSNDLLDELRTGTSMKQLPVGLAHTEVVEVSVDHTLLPGGSGSLAVELLEPSSAKNVQRVQAIRCKLANAAHLPVMLVRSMEKNSQWWVQDLMKLEGEDELVGIARFGNDKTPAGSNFLLVFLHPKTDLDRADMKPGTSFKDLPKLARSKAFVFRREASDKPAASAVSQANQ